MMETGDKKIGELIRKFRKTRGMSQMELAELMGVSYQQVQKYETGTSNLTIGRIRQLAGALGVSVYMLIPPGGDMVSDNVTDYMHMTLEEQDLLRLFREIRDVNVKNACLELIKAVSLY